MATLVVIGYADQNIAEDARKSVQELEDELDIQADHVASIARDVKGRYDAHVSHRDASGGKGVDWGGLWAPLFGLLFSIPAAGAALGPSSASLSDSLGEEGIDKAFRNKIREQVKPGTSAVFMMIEHAAPDKAVDALQLYGGATIETSVSDAQLERLREALRVPTPEDKPAAAVHRSG